VYGTIARRNGAAGGGITIIMLNRRAVLSGVSATLVTRPAFARSVAPPPGVADYETASGGHVGLYARNLMTGRAIAWRADERFVMCSTFKASLAACVLDGVDRGRFRLADEIALVPADLQDWHAPVARQNLARGEMSLGEMCRAAVEQSDNSCANILLQRIGGPAALTAYWRGLGDDVSRLDDIEPFLNRTPPGGLRNTTTPRAMAATIGRLTRGPVLSPSSRALLMLWLRQCRTGAARLRAGLPRGWAIGNKTGNNGKDAAGDVGVLWRDPDTPIIISVYTRGGTPTEAQFKTLFSEVARGVATTLA
jgi:beta-lactamase class A